MQIRLVDLDLIKNFFDLLYSLLCWIGKVTGIFLICVLFYPAIVTCQSRGEAYRGEVSTNKGYLRGSVQQIQTQLQGRPYPEYYQQQSQTQSYSNPLYNYPYQTYQNQPAQSSPPIQQFAQNYDRPAIVASAPNIPYTSRPKPSQNNNIQSQPNSNLANRFSQDAVNDQSEVFPTRAPKPSRPMTTVKTPVYTRFDDRDTASFKRTLSFDLELSKSMELFALELFNTIHTGLSNENFMISPFSIYHMLVLIAEGANGNTFREINEKLNLLNIDRTRDFQQYLSVALK